MPPRTEAYWVVRTAPRSATVLQAILRGHSSNCKADLPIGPQLCGAASVEINFKTGKTGLIIGRDPGKRDLARVLCKRTECRIDSEGRVDGAAIDRDASDSAPATFRQQLERLGDPRSIPSRRAVPGRGMIMNR
jgi:hypothetical protein